MSSTIAPSAPPKSYFVLIGGESCDTQGADLDKREYLHTSLFFVGKAYAQLRSAGVPRSQIISIVQLQDYLRSPLLVDEDCYARTSTLQSCHRLLAEGGADYDFEHVNSGTVFAVLLGLRSARFPKVVPNDSSTKSLFFAIYSHGNCHPSLSSSSSSSSSSGSVPPDVLRAQEELNRDSASEERRERTVPPDIPSHENEWFAHFPYPCEPPEYRDLMYAYISTDGGRSNGHKAPECQLYATHIAMIVARLCHQPQLLQQQSQQELQQELQQQQHPRRPVVGLLNFCRSGGGLDFMRREGFRSFYQPQHWPVYIMSAAQANKDALVGGLWDSYFQCLIEQLTAPPPSSPFPSSSSSITPPHLSLSPSRSLHDLFLVAKAKYRQKNVYELYGHICHEAYPSSGTSFRSDLQPLLTSGEWSTPDFVKIAQLQKDYRSRGCVTGAGEENHHDSGSGSGSSGSGSGGSSGSSNQPKKRRRRIYIYDTYNWGVEVDLVAVVSRCLLHIALPDSVFGEQSGVDRGSVRDIFRFEVEAEQPVGVEAVRSMIV